MRRRGYRRTEQSLSTSAKLFEQVVAREPEYARAWAGLADAYAVMAFYDYLPPHEAFARAESAARQAIVLDATLAAPHATLAYVDTYYHWNWESAEERFRRAIELEPTYSTAHQWYGSLLSARGRFDEAEWEARRAAELDPLSMIANSVIGLVFILSNQIDRAIHQLNSVLQLDETFCLAHYWMGLALERKGQPLKAMRFFERVLELTRGCAQPCPLVLAALARTHASAGDASSARAMLDELLERAYDDSAHSIAFLKVDPQLRKLADEPRFQALIERVDQVLADRELAVL